MVTGLGLAEFACGGCIDPRSQIRDLGHPAPGIILPNYAPVIAFQKREKLYKEQK